MHDEETGEWLDFIFTEGRTRIPSRISRAALTTHFGATDDGPSLVSIYVQHAETIHRHVKAKLRGRISPNAARPLELRVTDFAPQVRPATSASTSTVAKSPVVRFHCV